LPLATRHPLGCGCAALAEVAAQTIVEPLAPEEPRHVDLRGGRGTTDLRRLVADRCRRENKPNVPRCFTISAGPTP